MKILLSCLRTENSLIGFDLNQGEVFWTHKRSDLKTCGAALLNGALYTAADNFVARVDGSGIQRLVMQGPYQPLAHSVHPIDNDHIGVVDTGHSCLRIIHRDLTSQRAISPVATWPKVPQDAIHLNDFVRTTFGIYASCFDYRPWRAIQEKSTFEEWCTGGYGLILNLTGHAGRGTGRVVMCGLNHPHSLRLRNDHLFVCSSATGEVHKCRFLEDGTLERTESIALGKRHFVRGLLFENDSLLVGGSCARHGEQLSDKMSIYRTDDSLNTLEEIPLPFHGEIYEILPWTDEMDAISETLVRESKKER